MRCRMNTDIIHSQRRVELNQNDRDRTIVLSIGKSTEQMFSSQTTTTAK